MILLESRPASADTTLQQPAMQPSRGTKLALCAEASTVGFERIMCHPAAKHRDSLASDNAGFGVQQNPLRATWARRSPLSGMPVPVFLHDVERGFRV